MAQAQATWRSVVGHESIEGTLSGPLLQADALMAARKKDGSRAKGRGRKTARRKRK